MKLYNLNGTEKATVVENKDIMVRLVGAESLKNGWVYNGHEPFFVKINNVVNISLFLRNGASGVDIVLLNIPEQFRPKAVFGSKCVSNSGNQTIIINTNGNMTFDGTVGNEIFLQTSWLTN